MLEPLWSPGAKALELSSSGETVSWEPHPEGPSPVCLLDGGKSSLPPSPPPPAQHLVPISSAPGLRTAILISAVCSRRFVHTKAHYAPCRRAWAAAPCARPGVLLGWQGCLVWPFCPQHGVSAAASTTGRRVAQGPVGQRLACTRGPWNLAGAEERLLPLSTMVKSEGAALTCWNRQAPLERCLSGAAPHSPWPELRGTSCILGLGWASGRVTRLGRRRACLGPCYESLQGPAGGQRQLKTWEWPLRDSPPPSPFS